MKKIVIGKALNETHALTNCGMVNPKDFAERIDHVVLKDKYTITIKRSEQIPVGTMCLSGWQREWTRSSVNEEATVAPFYPNVESYLSKILIEIEPALKNRRFAVPFDVAEMGAVFSKSFDGLVFTKDQLIAFDFHGYHFKGKLLKLDVFSPDTEEVSLERSTGILNSRTAVAFQKSLDADFDLKGPTQENQIINPEFRFEELGIGGLGPEFQKLFRKAFASRIFPPQLVKKLGIQHVRGILLHGPPGTGKTLMARQIGQMLRAREPKVVNGPDILNKFVGQSEENIRNLFADAEEEYKKKGDASGLHLIIFDELDAICKQRGSRNDGTGVGDSIVNQLLTKIDGLKQINNFLVIGMTNRKDMIDEALLRAGRLEVEIEIGLPDEKGRHEILLIHTAEMRQNQLLSQDVNLEQVALKARNFSGAEIKALVGSAASFSFNRHIEGGSVARVAKNADEIVVTQEDFENALKETRPIFGVSEIEFEGTMRNGIISYSEWIPEILDSGLKFVEQVGTSQRTPLLTVLLHGSPGSGTTSLAAKIALSSQFPFIKLISADNYVGMTETQKVSAIAKVFDKAYKSPLSVIVVDCIEKLLDYAPMGSRYSNTVFQALAVLLKRLPPPDHRLLVICTTSKRDVIEEMGLNDSFEEIFVPNIKNPDEVFSVLEYLKSFPTEKNHQILEQLTKLTGNKTLNIGIKKLLVLIERARREKDKEVQKLLRDLTPYLRA